MDVQIFSFFLPIRSRYSIRDLVPTGCVKIVVANIELYLPGSCYMFWVNHILLINVSKELVVPSYIRNWSKLVFYVSKWILWSNNLQTAICTHAVTSGHYVIILYNHEKIMHAYYSFQNTITQIHREMRKLHYRTWYITYKKEKTTF